MLQENNLKKKKKKAHCFPNNWNLFAYSAHKQNYTIAELLYSTQVPCNTKLRCEEKLQKPQNPPKTFVCSSGFDYTEWLFLAAKQLQ